MAICDFCKKEMPSLTCTRTHIDGRPVIHYNQDYGGPDQRCHDCGVAFGGAHHPGCDLERCPKCKDQLITCGCLPDEPTAI